MQPKLAAIQDMKKCSTLKYYRRQGHGRNYGTTCTVIVYMYICLCRHEVQHAVYVKAARYPTLCSLKAPRGS
jgi:hypothetical protein